MAGLRWIGFSWKFVGLLVGQFTAVDGSCAGEVEGEANLIAVNVDDMDHTERMLGVADDDLFADTSGQSKHWLGPSDQGDCRQNPVRLIRGL